MLYDVFLTDLMGTLVIDGFPAMIRQIEEENRIPYGSLQQIVTEKYWPQWSLGKITEDEFWKKSTEDAGIKSANLDTKRLTAGILWYSQPFYNPMLTLAERLNNSGIRTGIITNISPEIFAGILQMPWYTEDKKRSLIEVFDTIVPSYKACVRKPDKRIYEIALERLQQSAFPIAANRVLYVDDEDVNLKTPKKMGMATIKYPSEDPMTAFYFPSDLTGDTLDELYSKAERTASRIEKLYIGRLR